MLPSIIDILSSELLNSAEHKRKVSEIIKRRNRQHDTFNTKTCHWSCNDVNYDECSCRVGC